MVEHFNGTGWSIVPSPDPETGASAFDGLQAIGGAGANDLWAVGTYGNSFIAPLLEHWNGASWSFVSPPEVSGIATAVSAVSSTDVWVVGDTDGGTFSLRWDGTTWSVIATPFLEDGSAPDNLLTGLTATGPTDVWASGYEGNVDQQNLSDPYVLHWNGTTWSLTRLPDPGSAGSMLTAITAVSAAEVWASGRTLQTDGGILSLTETFDGSAWSVAPSLDPGQLGPAPDSSLTGIAMAAPGTLLAVGAQETPNRCCVLTLAERASLGS